jgi:hypothetical protein
VPAKRSVLLLHAWLLCGAPLLLTAIVVAERAL